MNKPQSDPWIEKNKVPWVLGLLGLGLTALVISFYFQWTTVRSGSALFQIASVERAAGKVWRLNASLSQKGQISSSEKLVSLDNVETEEGSEALIYFENTGLVRVQAESLITVERNHLGDDVQDTLYVQRGSVKVEDPGREGELFISKNGVRVAAAAYNESALAKDAPLPLRPTSSAVSEASPSGLSDDEISTLLTAQRANFMKCYMALLQKEPEAKGELSMNFTIEPSGKVDLIEVASADLKDSQFHSCIKEVLGRVSFRSFTGTAISTFFPMKFE